MKKHEIEELQNDVKGTILKRIQEHLLSDPVDIETIKILGKLYTNVDRGW